MHSHMHAHMCAHAFKYCSYRVKGDHSEKHIGVTMESHVADTWSSPLATLIVS